MTTINEIAPDLFRLSIYVPDFDMQFNHFLVRDEEPLLFHAGFKGMFPALREAVARQAFKPFAGLTEIVPAELGEEVVLHGALALARRGVA